VLTGGQAGCERQAAFFLPEHMAAEDFDPAEHIRAVKLQAHFGAPGHRDYLGAALGLGITRESLGDIRIFDDVAYLFCLPTVEPLLLEELKKVGRVSVTASPCPLAEVPAPQIQVKALSFTVRSLRLDAILGGMFGLSRTAAAEQIRMGLASLNYTICERTDAAVKEGDVISLRGRGKGCLKAVGGRSKKDRLFVETEVYL
jgi:RNA-binding protein YlmH